MAQVKDWMLVVGVIAIIGLAIMAFGGKTFSTTGGLGGTAEQPAPVAIAQQNIASGTAAKLQVAVFDDQADSSSQVVSDLYVWKGAAAESSTTLLANGVASSATARTEVSQVSVGDVVSAIAFKAAYPYGKVANNVKIASEQQTLDLDGSKGITSSNIAVSFFDENGDSQSAVSLAAQDTTTLTKIRVKANEADAAVRLGLICADFIQSSNLSTSGIEIKGLNTVSVPRRLTQGGYDVDKCWEVPTQLVADFSTFETSSVVVEAGANDPSGEVITFYVVDKAPFVTKSRSLGDSYETDDPNSPVDVGIADKTATLTIN